MFGKFMNKKFFHPGSYPNIKQKWIHEQREAGKKKVEEELQVGISLFSLQELIMCYVV